MTLQSDAPLVRQPLEVSARNAREIGRLVTDGYLTLDAPYQRGAVWSLEQQRNLVRSWLLGVPIPAVILNARFHQGFIHPSGEQQFECAAIDGKQRILTAIAWFDGDLAVPASWFEPGKLTATRQTDDGPYVTINDLELAERRDQNVSWTLPVAEARVKTIADEARLFSLVNGAGVPQDQDVLDRAAHLATDATI